MASSRGDARRMAARVTAPTENAPARRPPGYVPLLVHAYSLGVRLEWTEGKLKVRSRVATRVLSRALQASAFGTKNSLTDAIARDQAALDYDAKLARALELTMVEFSVDILDGILVVGAQPSVLGPGGMAWSLLDQESWRRVCSACGWPVIDAASTSHASCEAGA